MDTQAVTISPYLLARYNSIYEVVFAAGDVGLSVSDIARHQGLKSKCYVTRLLSSMVAAGWLCCEFVYGRYHHFRYWVVSTSIQ